VSPCKSHISNIKSFLPVEAEISATNVFITANMKNSKSHGKQEVGVRYTWRNDFIFDIWLWHGDLYRVSLFQVYHTSTSCLQCDLEFFMFAVMKTFVTVISASTGRNDF
jgi:hypothetical protein